MEKILLYMINTPQMIDLILSIPAVLIALTFHEVSHGYMAYRLGDPTAKALGRLSLNPLHHLDPIGAICLLLFRFGWARPVPINSRYFKKPRRDMALTALSGPVTNLILSFVSLFFYYFFQWTIFRMVGTSELSDFLAKFIAYFIRFLSISHILNLSLCIFNLIPIPPLDGSRILYVFLPPKYYFGIMKYERFIAIALFLALSFELLDVPLLHITSALSNAMMRIINLIPFNF